MSKERKKAREGWVQKVSKVGVLSEPSKQNKERRTNEAK